MAMFEKAEDEHGDLISKKNIIEVDEAFERKVEPESLGVDEIEDELHRGSSVAARDDENAMICHSLICVRAVNSDWRKLKGRKNGLKLLNVRKKVNQATKKKQIQDKYTTTSKFISKWRVCKYESHIKDKSFSSHLHRLAPRVQHTPSKPQ
ncbi:hypothetical protein L6452_02810 [Arctium lappa]|uniref:Uncharacterized protein n=1 Tax=Arctium lappa TaxID=4217 RepID=A0ACB9FK45_ARCLA|nr:hypothetical protein L6452_02810 [Arctium lappa]